MAGLKNNSKENIALPTLAIPKERDYAPRSDPNSAYDTPQGELDHHIDHSDTDSATNSSDEFNWDEEDGASAEKNGKVKASRGRFMYHLFMKLARPIRLLLVGVLGVGILITPLLVFQFRFKSNVARPHVHMWSLWLAIAWAAGCLTSLVVDAIPKLIISTIVLFGGQVERLKMLLELALAVSHWLQLTLDVTWLWVALSVLRSILHPPGSYWVIVNRVMQALFSTSLILLVEKIFLQYVAINFHQKALADRLAENRLGLKALDRLSNAQPAPQRSVYGRRGHKNSPSNSIGKALDNAHAANGGASANGSPVHEKMDSHQEPHHHKRQGNKAQRKEKRKKAIAAVIVDQVGDAIGQVTLKNSKFNKEGDYGSLYSARKLARKLFSTLSDVVPPRSHLLVSDFYPYFNSTAEADAAFALFDKDSNGDISRKEMREAVQRIYRERKALTASLKDVGSAVSKLDAVLISVALVGVIFVCLLIFNRSNTLASLVPLATLILGFSFIFGHSAQLLFESLIFIFSTHVFDVGDLVMIDDQPLMVREFGLFSTTFRRLDGQEIVAPNSLLANEKLIHNLRRSNSMWETTELTISYKTPMEVVDQLRRRLDEYIQANNREWSGSAVNIDKMQYQNDMTLIVAMEHRANWQDWGARFARRTALMKFLKQLMEELDIRYQLPLLPVTLPRGGPDPYVPTKLQSTPRKNTEGSLRGREGSTRSHGRHGSIESMGNAGVFRTNEAFRRVPGGLREGRGGTF